MADQEKSKMADQEKSKKRNRSRMIRCLETVDDIFNISSIYEVSLKYAFTRFQSSQLLHSDNLLPALECLVKNITDEIDEKAGKLCLRPVSQPDLDALLQSDKSINISQPIDIAQFDEIAKKMIKRIAVERSIRLGAFVVGGIVAVHIFKGTFRKLPIVGPVVGVVLDFFAPTILLGPAAGVTGAMYIG